MTKIGKTRDNSPFFRATIAADGSFRIDDVPPGEHVIDTGFSHDAHGSLSQHRLIAPPVANGRLGEAVEIGTIT